MTRSNGDPLNDAQRLLALAQSGLLDSNPSRSFDRLAGLAAELLSAPVALVSLVDADRQFFKSCIGLAEPYRTQRETPLSHSFCARVVASDEPLVVEDARIHPELAANPAIADLGVVAYLGFPIHAPEGDVLGSFCVIDHVPRCWSKDEIRLLGALSESVTSEVALIVAARRERVARQAAEDQGRRLTLLAAASGVLSTSFRRGHEELLNELACLVVPDHADVFAVSLSDGAAGRRRTLVVEASPDGTRAPTWVPQTSTKGFFPALAAHVRLTSIAGQPAEFDRGGVIQLDGSATRAPREQNPLLTDLTAAGARSLVAIRLCAGDREVGVLVAASHRADAFTQEDAQVFVELGARVALAIDAAKLYRERIRALETLQAALLPPHMPQIEGVELGARYQALGAGAVGGDFYDLFQLAADTWVVVLGDVMGKGVEAAALTGLARHTIRAAAVQRRSPSEILRVLNDVLYTRPSRNHEAEQFATVLCAIVVRKGDVAQITVANGGHAYPVWATANGATEVIVGGTLMGLFPDVQLDDRTIEVGLGEYFVGFTDGVTEARSRNGFYGNARLLKVISASVGRSAQELADRVTDDVAAFHQGRARDDVAILALRVVAF